MMSTNISKIVSGFLPNLIECKIALRQLVMSADYASLLAPNSWGVTLYKNLFRLNVGRVEVLVVSENTIRLNCIGEIGNEPFFGANFQRPDYRSIPDPKCAFVGSMREFSEMAAVLQPHHQRFIDLAARKKSGEPISGSKYTSSHCPELISYARELLSGYEIAPQHIEYWTGDLEEIPEDILYEGARLTIAVNAYERNRVARSRCLSHHGVKCCVCGFKSSIIYGDSCSDVIHVHHIRLLSESNERRVVDPIADLRPVCPNCHAVIHSRNPPYSIREVSEMIKSVQRPDSEE